MLATKRLATSCPDGQTTATAEANNAGLFWRLLAVGIVLLASGGSAAQAGSGRTTSTSPTAFGTASVGCPPAAAGPLPGIPTVELPCLSNGDTRVPIGPMFDHPEVINVWASWCGPCRKEMPMFQAAHQAYGDQVVFIGVDTRDDRQAALRFLAAFGATYPQVFDSTARFASASGAMGIPYTVIVDSSGTIVYRQFGTITSQTLRAALAEAGVTAAPFS